MKKVLIALLLLIVVVVASMYVYTRQLRPDYKGEIVLKGLNADVEVLFDEFGVPHIYGTTEEDVYYALGYLHAQDRLWQMDVLRRIAAGRLAEVFGEELVETDKFFRTLGIDRYSKGNVERMLEDKNDAYVKMGLAYFEGVNKFIEVGPTPIEFTLVGLEKSSFSLIDAENVMGFMAFSFAVAHKTDPLLTNIIEKHGLDYLNDLDVGLPTKKILTELSEESVLSQIGIHTSNVLSALPLAEWIGSNSWVVGPDKSKSGKVLLANDPHIAFSQPGAWYEAHLNYPDQEIYGHYLAGYPFATLMFNRNIAIGLTMFENDDIDFYKTVEGPTPGSYVYNDSLIPFNVHEELIRVKDADDVTLEVRATVHGPVVTDILDDASPESVLSMWWVYTRFPGKVLQTMYGIGTSANHQQVQSHLANLHAPGINFMYGDKEGNIAWWSCAKLPIRPDHVNSKVILDGTTSRDEPTGYFEFDQNPHSVNPSSNYIYSANHQPDSVDGTLYPGYYVPNTRAERILEMMESKDKIDVEFYKQMLADNGSSQAERLSAEFFSVIAPSVDNKSLIGLLDGWSGSHNLDEAAPVLYHKLFYHVLSLCMADELGDSFEGFLGTHLFKRSVQGIFLNDSSVWWDNVHTEDIETREEVFLSAYALSQSELTNQLGSDHTIWNWGDVHTLEHEHPLGKVDLLRPYFNVGPFRMEATTEALNNLMFQPTASGLYKVLAGPSTRRIIDFSDIEHTLSILPTGQSGNMFSKHYDDQAELFNSNQYRVQLINRAEIELNSTKLLLIAE